MSRNKIRKFFTEVFVIIAMLLIGYGFYLFQPILTYFWGGLCALVISFSLHSEYEDKKEQEDEA